MQPLKPCLRRAYAGSGRSDQAPTEKQGSAPAPQGQPLGAELHQTWTLSLCARTAYTRSLRERARTAGALPLPVNSTLSSSSLCCTKAVYTARDAQTAGRLLVTGKAPGRQAVSSYIGGWGGTERFLCMFMGTDF